MAVKNIRKLISESCVSIIYHDTTLRPNDTTTQTLNNMAATTKMFSHVITNKNACGSIIIIIIITFLLFLVLGFIIKPSTKNNKNAVKSDVKTGRI